MLEFDVVNLDGSVQENLKDIYEYEEPYSNVELTGLVALFEELKKEIETNWM